MPQQEILLNSLEQYRKDLSHIPQLTHTQERELEEFARQGNRKAKLQLIESCLYYVSCIAWRYVPYLKHDSYQDIVSVGNLAIVESLEKSLTKENPSAYLRAVAKGEICHYCYYHSDLIERGSHQENIPQIYSLDALYPLEVGEEQLLPEPEQFPVDCEALHHAIHTLSETQQHVIMRHYGLDGDIPESLVSIGKRLASSKKGTIAYFHWSRALQQLQRLLLTQTRNNRSNNLAEAG